VSVSPLTVLRPACIEELLSLLREHGDEASLYAGATELVVAMKLGLTDTQLLIDLKGVAELADVMVDDDRLRLGATVTHRYLERDPEIAATVPVFAKLESRVANARVRAIGTLGGNLAFGEPHSDPATFLVAAEASYLLTGSDGAERVVPAAEFLRGPFEADLRPAELLTEVQVPLRPERVFAYQRFVLTERPVANVAIRLDVADQAVADARVVVGAATPLPVCVADAQEALRGASLIPSSALAMTVATAVADQVEPEPGSDPDYLRHLTRTLTIRALEDALASARRLPRGAGGRGRATRPGWLPGVFGRRLR
jgi:carbon-monoxide dehydrogenase medium subunit